MKRGLWPGIFLFLFMLGVGVRITQNSWQGLVFLNLEDPRSPAAIPGNINFSHLKGEDLWAKANKTLLEGARAIHTAEEVGIELGHFAVAGSDGKPYMACQIYNKIEMTFLAEGIAENGEAPVMIVEGSCGMDRQKISRISPIWIPVARILGDRPGDVELNFFDDKPVTLRFDHLGSEWPRTWVLDSVRLYSTENSAKAMVVDTKQIHEVTAEPMKLTW